MNGVPLLTLDELIDAGVIELGRGNIISKKDISACPGRYPIYSSAKENDGKFGDYGKFMFDEELITWSVDGGGRLFHRSKHKFSVTNVGGTLRILDTTVLDYRYLYYVLTIRHAEIAFDWVLKAHPSTIRKLYKDIPVPSLPEQQRIVTLLDEAFESIATAKANAEKNLQNARAIFESHLQSVFTDQAKEWPNRLLGDVFHIGSSKRIYETDWTSQGVPFYGGREIVKLAKYGSVESASFISEEKFQEYASKYEMPQAGDILMTARGTIGVGYIVKPGDKFYYKDGNVISLRAKNPSNPQFVLYAFRSNAILDQLAVLVGTTVSHLPIEKAKMLKICIPTFEVQNFIVEHLEMMEAHSKDLESIYQQKLAALAELKKSLLHQAFSGAL